MGVLEQVLGWLPISLGLVVEDETSELSRRFQKSVSCP